MPTHECLGPDDREDLQDRRKPAIKQNKEPAIIVRKPDATMEPAPHNIQLMSKHRVLGFKPQLRPEWRGQDGQSEAEQPDHPASLGDSNAASHSDEVCPNADRENTRRTVIREKLPITCALSGTVHSTGRTEPDRCTKALEGFLPPAFPWLIFSGKS